MATDRQPPDVDLLAELDEGLPLLGYCPMGCGETLQAVRDGSEPDHEITCTNPDCPRPEAAHQILCDAETEHLVDFGERTFTVKHPLRERLDDALMTCQLHNHIEGLDGPPVALGRYRAIAFDGGWAWRALTEATDRDGRYVEATVDGGR